MRRDWWAPLSGVVFVVLSILSFIVAGEPPDADEGAREVADFYADNKGSVQTGAILATLAAAALVTFGSVLAKARSQDEARTPGDDRGGVLPRILLGGTIILATGIAIDATLMFAMAEAVDNGVEPGTIHPLQALWDNDFLPLALGMSLFLLGTGLSIVRHGGLPRWLGWIAVALAVLVFTPVGFVAFMAGALWVLALSVMMMLQRRAAGTGAAGPPPPPPAPVTPPPPGPTVA